jgi:small subunit ribosomal protein S6
MSLYEHVFLTRQDVSNAQVEALTKEYSDVIEQGGGKIAKSEYWGVKSLAYKIKKNRKAHFSLLNIDAPHEAVAEMERRMGLSTEIIRFLTVKVEEHESEPSVMMRKSDRDDRRDGDRPGGFGGRGGRGGGFRGDRDGERRGPRGDREGGRGDREGGRGDREGSSFRARPPRPDREGGDRPPRPPRESKDSTADSTAAGPAPGAEPKSEPET